MKPDNIRHAILNKISLHKNQNRNHFLIHDTHGPHAFYNYRTLQYICETYIWYFISTLKKHTVLMNWFENIYFNFISKDLVQWQVGLPIFLWMWIDSHAVNVNTLKDVYINHGCMENVEKTFGRFLFKNSFGYTSEKSLASAGKSTFLVHENMVQGIVVNFTHSLGIKKGSFPRIFLGILQRKVWQLQDLPFLLHKNIDPIQENFLAPWEMKVFFKEFIWVHFGGSLASAGKFTFFKWEHGSGDCRKVYSLPGKKLRFLSKNLSGDTLGESLASAGKFILFTTVHDNMEKIVENFSASLGNKCFSIRIRPIK